MASILKYRLLDIDNNSDEKFSSECKKYFTRVGQVELNKGIGLLTGLFDLFEEGAALGTNPLEVKGNDVAFSALILLIFKNLLLYLLEIW